MPAVATGGAAKSASTDSDAALSPVDLVVFADDWGRHPSSAQHLLGQLLPDYRALWVNTLGTRRPGLSVGDLKKIAGKLRQWIRRSAAGPALPAGLSVANPRMYPGFRTGWQRKLNANLLTRQVNRAIHETFAPPASAQDVCCANRRQRIAVTTLPIAADLVGSLDVDRWVYYCVDDFAAWPGLDATVMQAMEAKLVERVDRVVAVSDTLVQRMAALGKDAKLLTHGIDLAHWQGRGEMTNGEAAAAAKSGGYSERVRQPIYLFWGLIDRRLNVEWVRALADQGGGTVVLAGPVQSPDPALAVMQNVLMAGPVAYADLPAWAAAADVLVMPYADLPVTRAMQPLKLKEYLATGKPTVLAKLPATLPWADACDVVADEAQFVAVAQTRAKQGLPGNQQEARRRLADETWVAKARQFARYLAPEVIQ